MSKVAEIKEKIAKIEKGINSPATPDAQRKVMTIVKERLTKELKEAEEAESSKKPEPAKKAAKPAKAAKAAKTAKAERKPKEKWTITINGKQYDAEDCKEAILAWKARAKQSKEASAEYKTKPVAQKVADNLKTAVNQAVDGVSNSRMAKNSADVIKGADMVKKAIEDMFKGFEKMTGKKISDAQRKQIMAILMDLKEEIKDEKKKFELGGEVGDNYVEVYSNDDKEVVDALKSSAKYKLGYSAIKVVSNGDNWSIMVPKSIATRTKKFIDNNKHVYGDKR